MTTTTQPTAAGRSGDEHRHVAPRAHRVTRADWVGTWPLLRLALRRDRVLVPVWLLVFVVTAAGTARSTIEVYPDAASRREIALTVNATTSMVALYGRIFDVDSLGEVALFKFGAFGAALVAILTIVLTTRHTRTEEEAGRTELVGAGVVGRLAPLGAALTLVAGTSVVLGLLTAAGLAAVGLPAGGSLAFGMSWAVAGLSYAAVAAVAAQLVTSGRGANGLAMGVLAVTYALRAVGDTATTDAGRALSWVSPVGWSQQVRAYSGDRWWVLGLSTVFAVAVAGAAVALVARRDLGAGLLPDRPGPASAGRLLSTPEGLALRLHRGTIIGWSVAYALLGLVLGGIVSNVDQAFASSPARAMIAALGGEQAMTDAYLATVTAFVGIGTTAFAVQAALRMRGEELADRAEPVLATRTTRLRWAAGHLLMSMGGATWLLLVCGVSAGSAVSSSTHQSRYLAELLKGSLVQLPAVAVVVGITVLLIGALPRAATLGWAALVAFLLLGEVGPLLKLDPRVLDLSPYAHVPHVPGPGFSWTPLMWLTAIAVALFVAGLGALRRRDLD